MPFLRSPIFSALLLAALAFPLRAESISIQSGPAPTIITPVDSASDDLVEFLHRRATINPTDTDSLLDLARWARDRQMFAQSGEVTRQILAHDPDNRPAWLLLKDVDGAISLPLEPQNETALQTEFQDRFHHPFTTRNSRHFLICYDTTDAFAAQRGIVLEKSYDAFLFYFSMATIRPRFLDHRLVVILFKNRDDYLAYAKQTEGADLSWASGYYSQRTNRSAFYDDSSSPGAEKVASDLDKLRVNLHQINADIDQAKSKNQLGAVNQLTVQRNQISSLIFQATNRVSNAVGVLNDSKTLHEAAHQLSFNTNIQKRLVDYPLWFSEGLACCFEVEDRTGYRGPAIVNGGRLGILKQAIKANQFITLSDFIAHAQPASLSPADLSLFYAESWGLFHYLYKFNRAGTEKFLLTYLRTPALRVLSDQDRLTRFTDAFGDDLPALQSKFTRYIQDLPEKAP